MLEPRFQLLIEQQEAQRREVHASKREQLASMEKPFTGMQAREAELQRRRKERMERDQERQVEAARAAAFKANPIPAAVYAQSEEEERRREEERRQRIEARKMELLASSAYPLNMNRSVSRERAASREQREREEEEEERRRRMAPREVPNFAQIHAALQEKQKAARPDLDRAEQRRLEKQRAKEEEAERQRRERAESAKLATQRLSESGKLHVSTKAMEMRQEQTKRMMEERRAKEEQEKVDAEERKRRQKEASARLRPYLEGSSLSLHEHSAEHDADAKRRSFNEGAQRQAKELRERLERSLAERPPLLQRMRMDEARSKARQTALVKVHDATSVAHAALKFKRGVMRKQRVLDEDEQDVVLSAVAARAASAAKPSDSEDGPASEAATGSQSAAEGATQRSQVVAQVSRRLAAGAGAGPGAASEEENYDFLT